MHESFVLEVHWKLSSWTRFMRNGVLEKVALNCKALRASLQLQTGGHRHFLQSSDGLKWTGLRWDNPSLRAHDDSSSRGGKKESA
ncbi:hypothetical protein QQF64_005204 [Cirrhinus molitorella]|uniref:Uncharacterized protein n=1 Tax=Cirrhinus molitorella TaxID=172907 RepID=A0ABR3MKJ1_9TELE